MLRIINSTIFIIFSESIMNNFQLSFRKWNSYFIIHWFLRTVIFYVLLFVPDRKLLHHARQTMRSFGLARFSFWRF